MLNVVQDLTSSMSFFLSLPKITSILAAIILFPGASMQGALLYHFTFEDGTAQSLANTGTVGGVATNGSIGGGFTGTYTDDIPPTVGNVWAYNLPSNGIQGSMLNLPDVTQLRLTNSTDQLTIAMWVKLDGDAQRVDGLAGNQASQNGGSGWSFSINNTTNKLQFTMHNPTVVSYPIVRTYSAADTVPFGEWVHVAVVYTNNAATFYINGLSLGGASFGGNVAADNTGAVRIGSALADSQPIDGMVDDVRFYNEALTAQQIATLAIPEPGVSGLGVLGGLAFLMRRRRQRGACCR